MVESMLRAGVGDVFSTPALREVMSGRFDGRAFRTLARLVDAGALRPGGDATVGQAVAGYHRWMCGHYRNEHVFKNVLANRFVAGGGLGSATLLFEFRVAGSLADVVSVGDRMVVYEIKSALDGSARLRTQLADYRRVSPRVVVVTEERLAGRYLQLLEGQSAGLSVLNRAGRLVEVVAPAGDSSALSVEAMFKSLRKAEYTQAVARLHGNVPQVPNGLHFRVCLELARQYSAAQFHGEFVAALRGRRLAAGVDRAELVDIRQLCMRLAPRPAALSRLVEWLGVPVQK